MKTDLIFKLIEMLVSNDSQEEKPTNESAHEYYGKHVIVRCGNAGVHFGILKSVNGRSVELINTRRMWRWYGDGSGDGNG